MCSEPTKYATSIIYIFMVLTIYRKTRSRITYFRKHTEIETSLKRSHQFEDEDSNQSALGQSNQSASLDLEQPRVKRRVLNGGISLSQVRHPRTLRSRPGNRHSQHQHLQPKLTQLTLDLGQPLRTTCPQCGMSYHLSDNSDAAVHTRFHENSVGGIDHSSRPSRVLWECAERNNPAYIYVIDRNSSVSEKRKVREVLTTVDTELSAAEIPDNVLWNQSDTYRAYIYVAETTKRKHKVIGFLLAKRIQKAYFARLEGNKGSSCVSIGGEPQEAVMGVSRIWTCISYRRIGIAMKMLDVAMDTFIYGLKLDKTVVAFSQPTESGKNLAKAWCKHNTDIANACENVEDEDWMLFKED
ncbi:ESCO1/2 acetyl-transferase-domain-containing protein [Geopyxis carbonaria]|nr:ESCO1/2 acetyl-transferase-domain-containing protein [Geopyxis carbonaria]